MSKQAILDLTAQLVQIPSYESEREIANFISDKLEEFGFQPEILASDLQHPSVICFIPKPGAKKTIWLECTLDTVPPGDLFSWKSNPLMAKVEDGKMYGLGVSDSKVAIAMFSILARELSADPNFQGNIFLGFDAQEQNGRFIGFKEVLPYVPKCDACILGYQDFDEIHIGARGWLRIKLTVFGQAAHTGSRRRKGINAIHKMNYAINTILAMDINNAQEKYFEFGSRLNISQISGGQSINIVPDKCEAYIEARITPKQHPKDILAAIHENLKKISEIDNEFNFNLEVLQAEQAYLTDPNHNLVTILQKNAQEITNKTLPLTASGPGSVGNIASQLEIPIINSFGVACNSAHSPNEWIDVETIEPVFEIWKKTLIEFCQS